MPGPILCAVEQPPPTELLQLAASLARRNEAQLAVLGVARPLPFPASLFLQASRVAVERERQRELLDEAAEMLAAVLREEPARCGIYAAVGAWDEVVSAHATAFGGDLLVVPGGTSSESTAGPPFHDRARRLVGRVSQIVLSVVRASGALPRRALVGVDFGWASEALVRAALAVLDAGDAELLLVHVTPSESSQWSTEWRDAYGAAAAAHMATLAERTAVAGGARVRTQIVAGEPAERLLALADAEGCDVLVVASRGGAGGPDDAAPTTGTGDRVGSVVDALLWEARRSVLVVPRAGTDDGAPEAGGHGMSAGTAIRRVLVPLDGSGVSERALPYAADVARRTGAQIELVHVRDGDSQTEAVPVHYPRVLTADPRLGRDVAVEATTLDGQTTDALLTQVVASRADLIVMTTAGRGGLQRALLGSVADAVTRRAEIPVLLVRADTALPDERARAPGRLFHRVLLPLDGSALAQRVIPQALAVTGVEGVHFVLLRVHPPPLTDSRPSPASVLRWRGKPPGDPYLSTMAARLASRGALVSIRAPVQAFAVDVIVRTAADEAVDLIAMATRGLGGVDRLLFGSVASDVVRRAPCAVLVVRPPESVEPELHVGADVWPAPPFT